MTTNQGEIIEEREVKVVMVGESGVGKSSLTLRFVTSQFRENAISTIGASFLSKSVLSDGVKTKFNIWDTAGQEKYRTLASLYYRGVDCAIVVYDVTDRNSYEQVKEYWIEEIINQCEKGSNVKICIAANKADLTEQRVVAQEEGEHLAQHYRAGYFETSAKLNQNISDIFLSLAHSIATEPDFRSASTANNNNAYKLDIPPPKKVKCC